MKRLVRRNDPSTGSGRRAQVRAEYDATHACLYGPTGVEFTHILSTFPLVGKDVKSAAIVEFRKMENLGEK